MFTRIYQRDIVQASVEQSDQIIQYALDKGYKPVRLDQCIRKPQKDAKGSGSSAGEDEEKDRKKSGTPKIPVPLPPIEPIHKQESSSNSASSNINPCFIML